MAPSSIGMCLWLHSPIHQDLTDVFLSTPGVLATWKVYEAEHGLNLEEVLRSANSAFRGWGLADFVVFPLKHRTVSERRTSRSQPENLPSS